MKKFKIWSMMMLVVMALSMIVACGGDDDNTPPNSNNPQTPGGNGPENGGKDRSAYWDDNLNPSTKNNYPYAVDMGLSVSWANKNLGTSKDYEPGGSYGWADPTGCYYINDLSYYPWGEIPSKIAGTNYDAATWNWGSHWRLPTKLEVEELINNSTIEWVKDAESGGKMLLKFTSKINGNFIFLSSTNIRRGKQVSNDGREGGYWTGDLSQNSDNAWTLSFYGNAEVKTYQRERSIGLSIRPVYVK